MNEIVFTLAGTDAIDQILKHSAELQAKNFQHATPDTIEMHPQTRMMVFSDPNCLPHMVPSLLKDLVDICGMKVRFDQSMPEGRVRLSIDRL